MRNHVLFLACIMPPLRGGISSTDTTSPPSGWRIFCPHCPPPDWGTHSQSSFFSTLSIRPPPYLLFCSPKTKKAPALSSAQIALQDLRFMPHSRAFYPGPPHAILWQSPSSSERKNGRLQVELSRRKSRACPEVEPVRGLSWEQRIG